MRLGVYEAFTDERGVATLEVPRGAYVLGVRKDGFKVLPVTVYVAGDVALQVEALTVATKAQVEDRMKRYEGEFWA